VTDAFQTSNVPPVGSGPLSFGGHAPSERLTLERNDEHFLRDDGLSARLARFEGRPSFDRLVLEVVGSGRGAVERVASGQADATFTTIPPVTVPRVGRAEGLQLYVDSTDAFYVVGYNTRREHLSNPRFRRVLGGLIDQSELVGGVFEGYATPAASPLDGTGWIPERLRWTDGDPVTPFLGADGALDLDRVRDAFRELGYRYDGDRLVSR
jgi:peptide/nickel transport system substrate-binding protein